MTLYGKKIHRSIVYDPSSQPVNFVFVVNDEYRMFIAEELVILFVYIKVIRYTSPPFGQENEFCKKKITILNSKKIIGTIYYYVINNRNFSTVVIGWFL